VTGQPQSEWQRKLSRLKRMSWDELRDRLEQGLAKRVDYARYRMGKMAGGDWQPDLATSGRFFFTEDERPSRVALLRQHLPATAERILQRANEICEHRFSLLGYPALPYGQPIDWHLDAVHGKRAPLRVWYKIPFLQFAEVGDHKVIWELNRHQHLVVLAKAWLLSGERKYLTELLAQWEDWQRSNPYPLGINWASSLEVAFRSVSWLWAWHLIRGAPDLPPSFPERLARALRLHGWYIDRYLSTYFSPNTHLLGEGFALFCLGTLAPAIPEAARWQGRGWEIVCNAARQQVRPDGVYFEQALYYHVYALDFFLHARALAAGNQVAVPAEYDATVRKMLDVVQALGQAGPPPGFGDDDGGRLFDPARNRSEHVSDPLALGRVQYGDDHLRAAELTEESLWLFGEQAVSQLSGRSSKGEISSAAFEAGGIYVLGDGSESALMTLDAGPQGTGRCGHGHADALSLRLSVAGRPVLVDSGTYVYMDEQDARTRFRGTAAHNTLRVDGRDQAEAAGPFAWNAIPTVQCERWVSTDGFDFWEAVHDGYGRLPDPVTHRRFVFHARGGAWLVRDVAAGKAIHDLEVYWHFAPDVRVSEFENGFVARFAGRANSLGSAASELAILHAARAAWKKELASGQVSPAYGALESAPVARVWARLSLPAECAFLLAPAAAGDAKAGVFVDKGSTAVRAFVYDNVVCSEVFLFADGAGVWEWNGWQTDTRFVYFRVKGGRLVHLIGVDGSSIKWQDREVIRHECKVGHFEWVDRSGEIEISSADQGAIALVLRESLEVMDSVR